MPELLHYTTVDGALGILRDNVLYASDILFMNDREEFYYSKRLLREELSNEIAATHEELRRLGLQAKKPFEDLLSEEFSVVYDAFTGPLLSLSPAFVASFSEPASAEVRQDGLLSQWRAYGSSEGVALVFDRDRLAMLLEREEKRWLYVGLWASPVRYLQYVSEDPELTKAARQLAKAIPGWSRANYAWMARTSP